jgi:hypothetical protein
VAVEGGVADAEVISKAAKEQAGESAFAKIAREACWRGVVVFEERGVAVDVAAEAFAEDEFGVGDVEGWVEGGPFGVLEDVFGPESLRAVGGFDGLVGLLAVGGGEGDVLVRVPILSEDDVVKLFCETVDKWDYSVTVCDG